MAGIVYDAGALVAAERRNNKMWALHEDALAAGIVPVVPAVVLAQVWRGGPQAELSRLLKGCDVVGDDELIARAAGRACGVSDTSDVVDAIVVVNAITRSALTVTSDPGDLRLIADASGITVKLHAI